jgi:pyridoxine 5-phosphate synthase
MKRLGINIDHIATVRNARGLHHPDPFLAAKYIMKCGANSITIHLREDRRHIKDADVIKLCKSKQIPINLELSLNDKILNIALQNRPDYICIVPENRKEITTEGGLNLLRNKKKIIRYIAKFKKKKIRTSLFINPNISDVKLANELKTDCIELHTGRLSNLIKTQKNYLNELSKIKKCCIVAKQLGIEVHAGHGLDYKTTKIINKISFISEFNIGHFIIGESIIHGLNNVIKKFRKIFNK